MMMRTPLTKSVFKAAFRLGLFLFFAIVGVAIYLNVVEIQSAEQVTPETFAFVRPYAFILVALFSLCALILWFEALFFVKDGWEERSGTQNMFLVIGLVMGLSLIGFLVHIYLAGPREQAKRGAHLKANDRKR